MPGAAESCHPPMVRGWDLQDKAGGRSARRIAACIHACQGGTKQLIGVVHRIRLIGSPLIALGQICRGLRRALALACVENRLRHADHGRDRVRIPQRRGVKAIHEDDPNAHAAKESPGMTVMEMGAGKATVGEPSMEVAAGNAIAMEPVVEVPARNAAAMEPSTEPPVMNPTNVGPALKAAPMSTATMEPTWM
jgi:hypothetical protein